MVESIRLGVAQAHTLSTTSKTLSALENEAKKASGQSVDLILFPEAYLGGYPRTAKFGGTIGTREPEAREQFLHYFKDAVDLGDTPEGSGRDWVDKKLEAPKKGARGDGTRERLEKIAKETGVFIVTGCIEKSGGTLYCAVVYVCPKYGVLGKRRKVMPTGSERLIWGQGQPSSLRAITTTIRGVKITLAAAICWENFMPLLRQSLYSQNVNLYLAPTADGRDTWLPLMRTIALEGRCVVLTANQCMTRSNLPSWITSQDKNKDSPKESQGINGGIPASARPRRKSTITEDGHEIVFPDAEDSADKPAGSIIESQASDYVSRGGSHIVSPLGEVLAGPLWDNENGLLIADVDFDDCLRGRLDLDVAGSYSRNDSFKLTVEGLDLSPPP